MNLAVQNLTTFKILKAFDRGRAIGGTPERSQEGASPVQRLMVTEAGQRDKWTVPASTDALTIFSARDDGKVASPWRRQGTERTIAEGSMEEDGANLGSRDRESS